MNAAKRTLGCWLLSAFLEKGCGPTTRLPRRVVFMRSLSARELAELNPLVASLVPLSNLLPMPRLRRRESLSISA
jgi:hypothetical protein